MVVGPPAALVLLVGNPLPGEAPSRDWLTEEISSDTLLDVLAIVLWLAWLHFVICLVVELVSDRRGIGLAPRVPGGGVGTQALARRLVGTALLLAGTAAATLPAAAAASQPLALPASATPAPTSETEATADHPEPTAADATTVTGASAGGVVKYYEVQPPSGRNYDTLWDIAERFLGSGLRYREIFELNKGVLQPDGRKLTNADLIQPGWLLQLPGDAEGSGLKVVDHRSTTDTRSETELAEAARHEVDRHEAAGQSQAPRTSEGRDAAEPADEVPAPSQETGSETGSLGPTDDTPRPAGVTEASDPETTAEATGSPWTPTFGVAGGLVAAGLLIALRRRRAAGSGLLLHRPDPGGGPVGPGGLTVADQEASLRWESDPTSAQLISQGLRAWPPVLFGGPVPRPSHCVLAPHGLSAIFSTPPAVAPPMPWRVEGDGRVWTLYRDDQRRIQDGPPALVPTPALVAFGRQADDSILLMDLEAIPGAVSIGGDADQARAAAMSWAIDMAVHAWADDRRVWLVGFADAPTQVASQTVRVVDDIDRALEALEHTAARQRQACQHYGVDSVAAGRVAEPNARLWASELVVCSGVPAPDTLARLQDLAAHPEHAISVVIVGDSPQATARLAVSAGGELWSGPLGVDVAAQQLSVDAYRGLVDVFEAASVQDSGETEGLEALDAPELDPSVFDPRSRQPVEIGILGPVAVEADGPVDEGRRDLLTELVVYVALHTEGVHPNALTAALWPRGVTDDVVDATLAAAQAWLGVDESGQPRLGLVDGRWVVHRRGVRFDWDVFRALVRAADRPDVDKTAAVTQALELVRGDPWSQLPAHSYGWLAYDSIDSDARVAIVLAARRLAALAAERGDGRGARDAIIRGLDVAPAAEDLWRDALRLAARLGSRSDVRAVADEMYDAIDAHGSPAGATAETDALVEELIPGYRRSSAA